MVMCMIIGKPQTTVTRTLTDTKTASGIQTYTGVSFGPASADRLIAVDLGYISASPIGSVTIGGIAATRSVGVINSDSRACDIWVASVPTGTSGNIVLAALSGTWRSDIVVYAIVGSTSATPSATVTDNTSPISLGLSVPALGVAIFAAYYHVGTANSVTWTGATEDADVYDGSSGLMTAASTNSSGSITAAITANGTVTSASGVGASFN